MTFFSLTLLSNVLVATFLAGLAWCCQRLRHIRIAQYLWLLAFVKLVTPPIMSVPVPQTFLGENQSEVHTIPLTEQADPVPLPSVESTRPIQITPVEMPVSRHSTNAAVVEPVLQKTVNPVPWLLLLWGTGVCWLSLRTWRECCAIRSMVNLAKPASGETKRKSDAVATQLGLQRAPRLFIAPGDCPPFSIGLLRPRVILAAALTGESAFTAVTAHEFCHIQRRDHWHRLLETICVCLFWWLPTVWLIRRQLRFCEDILCDRTAQQALGTTTTAYASAVVDVLTVHSAPPAAALATGFGNSTLLKRRIRMIVKPQRPGVFGTTLSLALFVCGLMVVPLTMELRADEQVTQKNVEQPVKDKPARQKKEQPKTETPQRYEVEIYPVENLVFPAAGIELIPKNLRKQVEALEKLNREIQKLEAAKSKSTKELIQAAKAAQKTKDLKRIRQLAADLEDSEKAIAAAHKKMEALIKKLNGGMGIEIFPAEGLPPGFVPPDLPGDLLPPPTGFDPNNLPPGILPPGFAPKDLPPAEFPPGFDPNNVPPGVLFPGEDIPPLGDLPAGFDPNTVSPGIKVDVPPGVQVEIQPEQP